MVLKRSSNTYCKRSPPKYHCWIYFIIGTTAESGVVRKDKTARIRQDEAGLQCRIGRRKPEGEIEIGIQNKRAIKIAEDREGQEADFDGKRA